MTRVLGVMLERGEQISYFSKKSFPRMATLSSHATRLFAVLVVSLSPPRTGTPLETVAFRKTQASCKRES